MGKTKRGGGKKKYAVLVGVALVLFLSASTVQAQTSCTASSTTTTINPNIVAADLPQFDTLDLDGATPLIAAYEMGIFLKGVDPNAVGSAPVTTIVIPRNQFTLTVAGSTCYEARPTALLATPAGQVLIAGLRALHQGDNAPTAWAVSNPFGRPAVVLPPAAVRAAKR